MAILLIGSTGSGKSCLGNFLIDPTGQKKTFVTAKSRLPETQRLQIGQSSINLPGRGAGDFKFTIIDTPGVDEKHSDLGHMMNTIETLRKINYIQACILVIKCDSNNTQYISTLRYYRKLLPSLFEKNVIIVMTEYVRKMPQTCSRMGYPIPMRMGYSDMDMGFNVGCHTKVVNIVDLMRDTVQAIVSSGCLSFKPMVFTIDSLPPTGNLYDVQALQEYNGINQKERASILHYISSLSPVINFETSKIPKTDYIKQKEQEIIRQYEGGISGYNEGLQQIQEKYSIKLKEIEQTEKNITNIRYHLKTLKEEMDDKNSSDLVVVGTWYFSKTSEGVGQEKNFQILVPFQNVTVTKWDNGNCTWEDFREIKTDDGTGTVVTGKLVGKLVGQLVGQLTELYAIVTIEAKKRDKYSIQIRELQVKIESLEKQAEKLNNHLDRIVANTEKCEKEVQLLRSYIAQKRKLIEDINSNWMTLEEAYQRHLEIYKHCNNY